jgi:mRNA interferase MazF
MREGDVLLASLPQADGGLKNRPVLFLRELPPFSDVLLCGISTQIARAVPDFDEVILRGDSDFPGTGLVADSVIRLGFLAVLPRTRILGSIGSISAERHARLLRRLAGYLIRHTAPSGE